MTRDINDLNIYVSAWPGETIGDVYDPLRYSNLRAISRGGTRKLYNSMDLHFGTKVNDPPLKTMPIINPNPEASIMSTVWRGLHMRVGDLSRASDWQAVSLAKIDAVKLLTNTDVAEIGQAIAKGLNPDKIVLRLFCDMTNRGYKEVTPAKFVDWQTIHLAHFMGAGCHWVEVHNEPNLPLEGLGTQWYNASEFAQWFTEVMSLIKAQYPNLKVGFPGLSPQMNTAEWLTTCRSAMLKADWVGVHCYWTDANLMNDPEHGGYWQKFTGLGKPLIITEFSNPSPNVNKATKGQQYAQYYAQLPNNILGAFCFVSSAVAGFNNETWVDNNVLSAIPAEVGAGVTFPPGPIEPPPAPPPSDLDKRLWDKSVEWQTASGIQLNAKAALQAAIEHDGMWPVTTELYQDGLAFMAAEDIHGVFARTVYVWQDGKVRHFTNPHK